MTTTAATPHSQAMATATALAFAPLAVALILLTGGLALGTGLTTEDVVDGVAMMSFPAVGALLLRRGVSPRIGWILSWVGVLVGLSIFAGGYSDHDVPGRAIAMLVSEAAFVAVMTTLLTFLPLYFPSGALPSPRWRFAVWASLATLVGGLAPVLFGPGVIDEDVADSPANPWGIAGAAGLLETVEMVALAGLAILSLTSLASMLLRLRHRTGTERRQIGILSAGVAVLVVLFLLDGVLQSIFGNVYGVLGAAVAISAIPVAVAIALLRPSVPSRGRLG